MKKLLSIHMLLLLVIMSKGQETVLSFAPTLNNVFHYQFVSGGPNANSRPGLNVAFEHVKSTTNRVSYGYGISYQFGQVKLIPAPMIEREPHTESINIISASFKTVFNFQKRYYLSTDPLIGIQLKSSSQKSISNQSGVGISIGYGKRILLNEKSSINIEPRLWIHNVVPFVDTDIPERLTVIGIKAGIKLGREN